MLGLPQTAFILAKVKRKGENKIQKTKIEWVKNPDGSPGYTINSVKGMCPVDCKDNQGKSYCYARAMYKRFKWNPELRYDASAWLGLGNLKEPSRIFVGSTMELFGDFIKPEWMYWILELPYKFPQHTFIFLTKCPWNLHQWLPYPPNVYIGVSVTNQEQYDKAIHYLKDIQATVKFLSFEPLLENLYFRPNDIKYLGISWLIIGAQTKPYKPPKIEWIQEIELAARRAGIAVFEKDNLQPLLKRELIQEMPR